MPLNTVNVQQGANYMELPIVYTVPILNGIIPSPTETAYLAYKNTSYRTFKN